VCVRITESLLYNTFKWMCPTASACHPGVTRKDFFLNDLSDGRIEALTDVRSTVKFHFSHTVFLLNGKFMAKSSDWTHFSNI